MSRVIQVLALLVVGVAMFYLGFVYDSADVNGPTSFTEKYCLARNIYHQAGKADCNYPEMATSLAIPGIVLILLSLCLLFVREQTYKSWRKFAYFGIPIEVIIIWFAPFQIPTGTGLVYQFTKESSSWLVSGAFLLISLIIIITKSLRGKATK